MTAQRQYRYYELVMVAFVVILICSNLIVARLKKAGQEDFYDRDTNFTPFSLK